MGLEDRSKPMFYSLGIKGQGLLVLLTIFDCYKETNCFYHRLGFGGQESKDTVIYLTKFTVIGRLDFMHTQNRSLWCIQDRSRQ